MLSPSNDIQTIAVFRALQLGDLLCSVPALRALRAAYPRAHIALIGMPWMKMLPERFPGYVDEFIWFPGYPGLPEQPLHVERTIAFLEEMRARRFDLALQMQGNGSVVNPMTELFGARYQGGFFRLEDYCPGEGFLLYPTGISEIHRHLLLMRHLGISALSDELEFPLLPADREALAAALPPLEAKKYICVHPGSRGGWRQWPPELFAAMANECIAMQYTVVLTGTSDELPIIQQVAAHLHAEPVLAAGKTHLGAMAALLSDAAGLISNCTGVSHMAAALHTRSVVISMDGEPERWAPLNTSLHITVDWTKTPDVEIVRQSVRRLFGASS